MTRAPRKILTTCLFIAWFAPAVALAHPGHVEHPGFVSGAPHPLTCIAIISAAAAALIILRELIARVVSRAAPPSRTSAAA